MNPMELAIGESCSAVDGGYITRIGRDAFVWSPTPRRVTLEQFFDMRRDLRGKMFRRKDGTGTPMSFSLTLLGEAGDPVRFLDEWEEDPR